MKKALLIALTLVISVAFVTVVFAQAPAAPEKAAPMAPEKVKKAPASGQKEEVTPGSVSKKADKGPAPKAKKGGQKEEVTPGSEGKKADKGPAPKAPKGGQKEEVPAPAVPVK